MSKTELKVGDRVRVYGRVDRYDMRKGDFLSGEVATIFGEVNGDGSIGIAIKGEHGLSCHVKQCRRLKPRVKVWPQYRCEFFSKYETSHYEFIMNKEDFNRMSPKQRKLLGVK